MYSHVKPTEVIETDWLGPQYKSFETDDFIYFVDTVNTMVTKKMREYLDDPEDKTTFIINYLDYSAALVINKKTKMIIKSRYF